MGLLDLLKDPTLYKVGEDGFRVPTINFTSKGLDYPNGERPLLGKRVSFDVTNDLANPTFEYGGDGYTRGTIDQFVRGGTKYAIEARKIDFDRIQAFFKTPNGELFLQKQVTLQSQNPRPQKLYNYGINTLASVAAAGVSNVRRGGLLPEVGGFDIGSILGLEAGTYLTEPDFETTPTPGNPTGTFHREKNYGLGDPGAPSAKTGLAKLIDIKNPFKSDKVGYNVSLGQEDKLNALGVFKSNDQIPSDYEKDTKDYVKFRFEVIDQDSKSGEYNIIAFRAFLDNISDDYNATHNAFKYNGRGEEFFTYNKFQRRIQLGFKIAAQTRWEMQPLYQKINYLAAQTAPNYSAEGRIRTPYVRLTVGNWFLKIPGLITNVGLSWQKDYPWEIALDRKYNKKDKKGKDRDMLVLPHVLDVNLNFQPIHSFTPSNSIWSPFIGINGDINSTNWMRAPLEKKQDEKEREKVPTIGEDFMKDWEELRKEREKAFRETGAPVISETRED